MNKKIKTSNDIKNVLNKWSLKILSLNAYLFSKIEDQRNSALRYVIVKSWFIILTTCDNLQDYTRGLWTVHVKPGVKNTFFFFCSFVIKEKAIKSMPSEFWKEIINPTEFLMVEHIETKCDNIVGIIGQWISQNTHLPFYYFDIDDQCFNLLLCGGFPIRIPF